MCTKGYRCPLSCVLVNFTTAHCLVKLSLCRTRTHGELLTSTFSKVPDARKGRLRLSQDLHYKGAVILHCAETVACENVRVVGHECQCRTEPSKCWTSTNRSRRDMKRRNFSARPNTITKVPENGTSLLVGSRRNAR